MIKGFNRLFVINEEKNLLYEFNPLEALTMTNFDLQKKYLFPDKGSEEEHKGEIKNFIDVIPK